MKIAEFYRTQKHTFSFEFFPPKTEKGEETLFREITELKCLAPSFVTCTYGAMGTTRDNTIRIVERIKSELTLEAAAHLTCIAHAPREIDAILEELHGIGVENVVALRGDRPQGETQFKTLTDGFRYAYELVRHIRRHPRFGQSFSLAVAGYPEAHVECRDKVKDLEYLKMKVDEGADVVITQLFFINGDYFDFVDRARKAGIKIPIVPGIMPVTNGAQIQKFSQLCGAVIPRPMTARIQQCGEDQPAIEAYGIEYATSQCRELLANGAPGLHFYTLNKSHATRQIYLNLGLPGRMPRPTGRTSGNRTEV